MSNNPAVVIGISAVDNARQVLQGVDQKVAGTASAVDTASTKIISRSSQMSAAFKQNLGNIAQSVAGLSAGIVGFATSFSTLEKAQTTANAAQVTYERSLQRLEKLRTSGTVTAEKLATAELDVKTNLEKVKLAQDNVNDVYANFLANVPNQIISFGVAGSGIMKLLGVSHFFAGTGASAQAKQTFVLTGALTHATRAAGTARFAFLTMIPPPLLIAIIAGSALVAIFAFNVGGLRDRIFELGNAILNFLDKHFKPLADAIRWFIDNVARPLGGFFSSSMPDSVMTAQNSLASFDSSVVNTGTGITTMVSNAETSFTSLETVGVQSALNIGASYNALWAKLQQGSGGVNPLAGLPGAFGGQGTPGASLVMNMTNFRNPAGGKQLQARIMQGGGILGEDVLGFGTRTGTPHMLHEGEQVIPKTGGSFGGVRGDVHIHLHVGSKEIAQVIAGDIDTILTRRHTKHMRITHEAIH